MKNPTIENAILISNLHINFKNQNLNKFNII